jgi:hypothetical protein
MELIVIITAIVLVVKRRMRIAKWNKIAKENKKDGDVKIEFID